MRVSDIVTSEEEKEEKEIECTEAAIPGTNTNHLFIDVQKIVKKIMDHQLLKKW